MSINFAKLVATDFALSWISRERPTAFCLLSIVAIRAKRSDDHPDKTLEVGEAFIGDWKNYCVSERCYRTDKDFLKKHKILTYKTTSKGTIAKIVSSDFFEIGEIKTTGKVTDKRRASDEQATTNKKIRREEDKNIYIVRTEDGSKNVSEEDMNKAILKIMEHYNQVCGTKTTSSLSWKSGFVYWIKEYTAKQIVSAISAIPKMVEIENKPNGFWSQMTLVKLFRIRNANGNADNIAELLNISNK